MARVGAPPLEATISRWLFLPTTPLEAGTSIPLLCYKWETMNPGQSPSLFTLPTSPPKTVGPRIRNVITQGPPMLLPLPNLRLLPRVSAPWTNSMVRTIFIIFSGHVIVYFKVGASDLNFTRPNARRVVLSVGAPAAVL